MSFYKFVPNHLNDLRKESTGHLLLLYNGLVPIFLMHTTICQAKGSLKPELRVPKLHEVVP